MNLFQLIQDQRHETDQLTQSPGAVRRLYTRSLSRSPGRHNVPDLSDTDQSTGSVDARDSSTEREKRDLLTTEMKLEKARIRREELHRNREIRVMDKHQQAIQRAQQNIQYQKERLQEKTSKVAHVIARRHLLEENHRDRILVSLENKLNDAVHRAEEICKKKQIKARNIRRAEKAKKRRVLLEYERRSAVLSVMDRRSEMAQKNVELLLKDRQIKAREEIEHAQLVSRRVKAAKVLQRTVRSILGVRDATREGAAAIQIQCWAPWRIHVACRRLLCSDEHSSSPLACLKSILCQMGYSNSSFSCVNPSPSFEDLTVEMNRDETLASTKRFLFTFDPIMGSRTCVSERTFLTAFLVTQQPNEVIGPKRGKDHCSRLLEQSSHRLVKSLMNLAKGIHGAEDPSQWTALVTRAASCILSYCTVFETWKNADIDDLVTQMSESATQSWIAYTIAKQVLCYIEEKETNILIGNNGDPFFQHKIRYKSSKKGAYSHIKRIRISVDKLLGAEKGFSVMKDARKNAMERIKQKNMIQNSKQEIDHICSEGLQDESSTSEGMKSEFDVRDTAALDDINEQLVHEILLADDGDLREQLFKEPTSSIVDCVDTFMDKFKKGIFDDSTTSDVGTFAFTMEKAFFDQIRDAWLQNEDMSGVKEVLLEILSKMRKLVPSRKDLHTHFSSSHVDNCLTTVDVLSLLLRLAKVLGDLLESPFRAKSTLHWCQTAAIFQERQIDIPFEFNDIKSYIVASLAFVVKKLDLCHADVINFRLGKLTPVIKTNGISYERSRFYKKYGTSTTYLAATKAWMERLKPELIECSLGLPVVLKKGFVDELLFVRERISMPEILCLDAARISSIRERSQRIVLTSSLLLLMCNIMAFQISCFESKDWKGKVKVHKDDLLRTLRSYASFEDLCVRSTQAILTFAEAILGKKLDDVLGQKLSQATESVLRGVDPVVSLMDKRIKDIFRSACTLNFKDVIPSSEGVPIKMRSGRSNVQRVQSVNTVKEKFCVEISSRALKVGFYGLIDDVVEVTYDAHKIINHCVQVHEEHVLFPLSDEIRNDSHVVN